MSRGRTLGRSFYARDVARPSRPSCSTRCSCTTTPASAGSRCASSRSRRTCGRDDPGSHAYRGHDDAQRHDVRPARPPVRVLHVRDALVRQRRRPAPRAPRTRCSCAPARRVDGVELMRARRPKARRDRDLCAGPGAPRARRSGSPARYDGADLARGAVRILDDGVAPPTRPVVSTRVGLARGRGRRAPVALLVPGDPHLSRGPRPGARG